MDETRESSSQQPQKAEDRLTCPIPGCPWYASGGTDEQRGAALADHMKTH